MPAREEPMTWAGFAIFSAAYCLAVASPGPGIAALVARVLARGSGGIWAFVAGMAAGDVIWLSVAAGGLAFIAQSYAPFLTAIRVAGAAYLLFIAWKMWRTAPAGGVGGDKGAAEPPLRLFLSALSLTLGNPKVIVFFVALLPALVDLERLTPADFFSVAALSALLLSSVCAVYVLAAHGARQLFSSPRALRRLNRATGAVMAGAAVAILARH